MITTHDRGNVAHEVLRRFRRLLRRFETARVEDGGTITATFDLPVQLGRDDLDGGWVARVPSLPGCYGWGATADAAVEDAVDAAQAIMDLNLQETAGLSEDPTADRPQASLSA